MEEITTFISNVGFPIVACFFMFRQNKELNTTITELSTTLKSIDVRIAKLEESEQ